MLKRILLAVAPVVMLVGAAGAEDDLLSRLASMDTDSIAAVEQTDALENEDQFGQADVDALLGEDEKDEDAIAACFRRIGYGYGYGRSFGYGYNYRCYRPVYHYNYCYRPVTYHYPVTYHVPVYTRYWACY